MDNRGKATVQVCMHVCVCGFQATHTSRAQRYDVAGGIESSIECHATSQCGKRIVNDKARASRRGGGWLTFLMSAAFNHGDAEKEEITHSKTQTRN